MPGSHSTRFACSWQATLTGGRQMKERNALVGGWRGVILWLLRMAESGEIFWFRSVESPGPVEGLWFVYVLQSGDGALYVGQTSHVRRRLTQHEGGLGTKHTREHGSPRLVFYEGPYSLQKAVEREAQLKRWSRAKKAALIRGDYELLRLLARSREVGE